MSRARTSQPLAIDGGTPARQTLLEFSPPIIGRAEIEAVVATLESRLAHRGPRVASSRSVSPTMQAPPTRSPPHRAPTRSTWRSGRGVGAGDRWSQARSLAGHRERDPARRSDPRFADIDPGTLNVDPEYVEAAITPRTRAVVGALRRRAVRHGRHRGGGEGSRRRDRRGRRPRGRGDRCARKIGAIGDLTCFSLYATEPRRRREGIVTTCGDGEAASASRPRDHARPLAPGADQTSATTTWSSRAEGQPGRPQPAAALPRSRESTSSEPTEPTSLSATTLASCRSPASSRSAGRGTVSTPTTSTSSGSTRGWPEPIATRTPRRSWPRTSPPASIFCRCTS